MCGLSDAVRQNDVKRRFRADSTGEKHMKTGISYSKREKRAITLGYLWRWGSLAVLILLPALVFGICNLLNIEPKTQIYVTFLFAGITMLCVGTYEMIGALLGFKHLLVSLQLASHMPFQTVNPKRGWSKSERREVTGSGVIFVLLGSAFIICFTLMHLGILN